MSLANNKHIIIPNTTGIITQAVKEANNYVRRTRGEAYISHAVSQENTAPYIRDMRKIHSILQYRASGIPLEQVVNPERISSNRSRVENYQMDEKAVDKEKDFEAKDNGNGQDIHRAYESWFMDR